MERRRLVPLIGIATLGLLVTGAAVAAPSVSREARGSAPVRRHHPAPAQFTDGRVDNAWFPLKPGTRWVYRGSEDRVHERDVMIATYRTKVVDGVTCRVVFDRVFAHGRLEERTFDWYAQTTRGTVWYFGENTATFDRHGHVQSREGSWTSGVGGAEAGIFMPRRPRVGSAFYQEYDPGNAVDTFRVLRYGARTRTPLLRTHHALLTREHTALEPDVVDHKYYVRDIGDVRELTVKGGDESLGLVSLTHVQRG
jgi:hypothetical protein